MSKRQDFSIRYLVALYLHHRNYRSHLPTIRDLKSKFNLPSNEYLELELIQFFESRGWAIASRVGNGEIDWPLTVQMSGKEAAESQIDTGFEVAELRLPVDLFQNFDFGLDETIQALTQDSPEVLAAKQAIDELQSALHTANDVGNLSVSERQAAIAEIGGLRKILDGSTVRLRYTIDIARRSLRWIAEKAGGTIIESLAQSAFLNILKIFGLNL